MFENIIELINDQKWEQAKQALLHLENAEFTDELAILSATVLFQTNDYEEAYNCICRGLQYNYKNYELYLMLGNYYELSNANQAFLCYENAEYYCSSQEDLEIIRSFKDQLTQNCDIQVRDTSIIILSHNSLQLTKQCIESIVGTAPVSSYEIIVVDNNSSDGSREWLTSQANISLICNNENQGFPVGCNQGIKAAAPENNILLLNSDTIVMPNSIFWLRMGLYESERVGATGSITNFAGNGQIIDERYSSVDDYKAYAEKHNVPLRYPYEKKCFLIGFAMLIRRTALDNIGLLDTRFSPGTYEDNDIGIRLLSAGWENLLCHNSFIFHYGGGGGKNNDFWRQIEITNSQKFQQKWGFDIRYYTWARKELISLIHKEKNEPIKVLEIGCGLGATLAKINYLWPHAIVSGIELVPKIADIASNYLDIIQGNIEEMELPYSLGCFDYIILGDVIEHLRNPQKTLLRLIPYLKKDGQFICSIPNLLHMSVIVPLLKGHFDYQDAGILDKTHLRFFTLDSIAKLFYSCHLKINEISGTLGDPLSNPEDREMLDHICKLPGVIDKQQFQIYQYIFTAGIRDEVINLPME